MSEHLIEIEINAEGSKLAYMSPIGEDGQPGSGYRIAGPKAWGGSRNIAKIAIRESDLVEYINRYAPNVLKAILEGKKEPNQ